MTAKQLRLLLAASTLVAAFAPTTGHAQVWLGTFATKYARAKSQADCVSGKLTALPREVTEAREPAIQLMREYWGTAMASAGRPVPAWVDGEISFKRSALNKLRDPFATDSELELSAEPSSFARAADQPMNDAVGVWQVHTKGNPAAVRGYYVIEFKRFMLKWGVSRIHLVTADQPEPKVGHYCT